MNKYSLWELYFEEKNKEKKEKLKQEIILEYVNLVKIISGRLYNFYGSNIDYEDLVSYGIIGLIDAIDKYDLSKNIKFETYASIRIRGAIIDEIRNLDWIPRSIRQKSKMIKEVYKKYENLNGKEPTVEQLSKELNKTIPEVNKILEEVNIYNVVSLEEEISDNLKIQIEDKSEEMNPEASLMKKDMINRLKTSVKKLKEREQMIINLYYFEELTYKEIGNILEISESRVSQIHSKAIIRIKNDLF
ncbi:MAG: FliA/WhiG family RNA polymerase sigma factor [Peptostreptococcaceae bacterium]|jgi:RNA polymerase sigma factor for flagellar operon FliA|nr:FliA/WhiG family RNA polymerase sigma factor [Peptostreptococcaceae bacterium]